MNRFSLVAIALAVAPAFARGGDPTPTPAVATATPVSCAPTLMQPLPVSPTVPAGICVAGCEKRPGFFRQLLDAFHSRTPAACAPACPTPVHIQLPATYSAKACEPTCPTGRAGPLTRLHRPTHDGTCWEKLKAWYCWKPCGEQLLPIGTPEPYRAPLFVYFPQCQEPTPGTPCAAGTCGHGKHGKKCDAGCPTSGCATPVGPVVSPFTYAGVGLPPVAPPAPPVAAPAVAQPTNVLARPFTSP